jgi:hypothetical protein
MLYIKLEEDLNAKTLVDLGESGEGRAGRKGAE